jgi:uncharacterized membrane protein
MKSKLPLAAFLGSAVLCALQALHYAPQLPERVASHFGPGGTPNGWMPGTLFIKINLGIVAVVAFMLYSVSARMRSLNPARINLPNKDYWLAPERRGETADFLAGYFLWFGTGTLLLMLDVFHQVFQYNLFQTRELDHPGVSLGLYMAFSLAWIAGLQLRFRRK